VSKEGFGTAAHEMQRDTITPQSDVCTWSDVRKAIQLYQEASVGSPSSFDVARVLNNSGMLWYALGADDLAFHDWKTAICMTDELSLPLVTSPLYCSTMEMHDDVLLSQVCLLGLGKLPMELDARVDAMIGWVQETIVKESNCKDTSGSAQHPLLNRLWASLDLDFLADGPRALADAYTRERATPIACAERLKLIWRKRITARINLVQLLVTAEFRSAAELAELLTELCSPLGPIHSTYLALDDTWYNSHGRYRTAIGIAAGLVDLLAHDEFHASTVSRATLLCDRIYGPPYYKGLYAFHRGKFIGCTTPYQDTFVDAQCLEKAVSAFDKPPHPTLRDVRMHAEALLELSAVDASRPVAVSDLVRVVNAVSTSGVAHEKQDAAGNEDYPTVMKLKARMKHGVTKVPTTPLTNEAAEILLDSVERALKTLEQYKTPCHVPISSLIPEYCC
jgi:hypothetical protein